MQTLPIIVNQTYDSDDSQTKGIFTPDSDTVLENVPVDTLSDNLNTVCNGVCKALSNLSKVGDFSLKEVSIQVEVSAQGGVNLIGSASVGGKGAITLKFEK
ncbi:hypothetical protein [Pseudoalteromonas sp. MTN2-4]|uniref:Pepco domain-containing protein n=1 Tax=Pseudoalteromonas sp. MTN2-4 TaxID=3056555 RepID=UPI0036F1B124